MQTALLEKYKIQITLYIQEMFKYFPTVCAADLQIKNSKKKNLITGQTENHYSLYLSPYLDLEHYQEVSGLSPESKISYIDDLYSKEEVAQSPYIENKRILDWHDFDDIVSMEDYAHRFDIENIDNKKYNFKQFSNKFLNFHILKNDEFIEEMYLSAQQENPSLDSYKHRFINGNTHSFFKFLGDNAGALYEKYAVEGALNDMMENTSSSAQTAQDNVENPDPNSAPIFSLEKFKI